MYTRGEVRLEGVLGAFGERAEQLGQAAQDFAFLEQLPLGVDFRVPLYAGEGESGPCEEAEVALLRGRKKKLDMVLLHGASPLVYRGRG